MTVRAPVDPGVIAWAFERSGTGVEDLQRSMPRLLPWLHGEQVPQPTFAQVQTIARRTGVPLGYLFLPSPPDLALPIPDFREGHDGPGDEPTMDLLAVVRASLLRQDWYLDYADGSGLGEVEVVGSAAELTPDEAAADMRSRLGYEVEQRAARSSENRRHLLDAFEDLGGLTVATSMVGNNTHRLLDPDEFRGFTLAEPLAPLIFINTNQTLNAQLFTIGHELAHVWRGSSGVSREDPAGEDQAVVEQWCNRVASEFLVPQADLIGHWEWAAGLDLTEQLDELAAVFRCGTLVILQAMRRHDLRRFEDFGAAYESELGRLLTLSEAKTSRATGGSFWESQRYRVGNRLATAIAREAAAGNTSASEAVRLTGMGSLSAFQELSRRIGVL